MDLIMNRLCDTPTGLVKPYNDLCAYPINQKANRILFVFLDGITKDIPDSIDTIVSLAGDGKVAVVFFMCDEE